MTGIHDTRSRNERSAECGDHDDERSPNLTLGVQNVKFSGKVNGEVEQAGKGNAAMSGGKALEPILQNIIVLLGANVNGLKGVTLRINLGLVYKTPANEVRPRLSDSILQSSSDCKGSADTQAQPKYTAVQLPQPVLEPVSSRKPLETGAIGRHGGLVREQAVDDHGIYANDDGGGEDDIDT